MADGRLFDLDGIPEVPIFREPRRAKAARGVALDSRFQNEYPPEWDRCTSCAGHGFRATRDGGKSFRDPPVVALSAEDEARGFVFFRCSDCLGMGSLKARVRLEAGHRCERCHHPYIPKGDAKMLDIEPTTFQWSPCDEFCTHLGPARMRETFRPGDYEWVEYDLSEHGGSPADFIVDYGPGGEAIRRWEVESEWRILTVHHLDGDKANCRWWNLAALCQRCHLEIQAKVVLERIYPHEHTEWFRPHAAGWYAFSYLGQDLTRDETLGRLDELLDLERIA